jgi:hypothetical protein
MSLTRGRRIWLLWAAALAGVLLLIPAGAQATITVGSNLGRAPEGAPSSYGCSPPCTFTQATLAADRQAAGGIVSPVNGTVILWRIRAAGASTPTALRVIKHLSGDLVTGGGTSATVTPALNSLSTYATQLPIAIGDSIGINCCQPSSQYFLLSGGTISVWNPTLADGGPGRANSGPGDPHEITLNAEIEPTSAFTLLTAKPRKGGKIKVTVNLPNPGRLSATGKGLHSHTTSVPAAGPFTLTVKPYFVTKRKLADGKKVKRKLKLTFTPTGGSAVAQAVKVKLRR